jgi:hypothetical protein
MSKSRQQNNWFDEDDLEYERDSYSKPFVKKNRKEIDKLEMRRQEQRKAQFNKINSFDTVTKEKDDWN